MPPLYKVEVSLCLPGSLAVISSPPVFPPACSLRWPAQRPPSASSSRSGDAPSGSAVKLSYKMLGRTGLRVTSVGFGCMITSDPSVIERAADLGINYFDTARSYQHGNNERMVGAALGAKRKQIVLSTKTQARDTDGMKQQLETEPARTQYRLHRHLVFARTQRP